MLEELCQVNKKDALLTEIKDTSLKGALPSFVKDRHILSLEWVDIIQRTRLKCLHARISAMVFFLSASHLSEHPSNGTVTRRNFEQREIRVRVFPWERWDTYIIWSMEKCMPYCFIQHIPNISRQKNGFTSQMKVYNEQWSAIYTTTRVPDGRRGQYPLKPIQIQRHRLRIKVKDRLTG